MCKHKQTVIVFTDRRLSSGEPFTTSEIIAEHTGIEHRKLKTVIRSHLKEFEGLGISASYQAENNVRKRDVLAFDVPKSNGRGRPEKVYRLNEPQATFLITLLKNTPVVVEFKQELVRQFFLMREELSKRQLARIEYKPIRRELTDAIQEHVPGNTWAFKQFTDLAYKKALGKTATQIRKERGVISKTPAVDFLTSSELDSVTKSTNSIVVLLDAGLDYQEIKEILLTRR